MPASFFFTSIGLIRRPQQRRIIETAISNTAGEIPQPSPETEEKLVAKVTTIFGILEQLGFTKERAEECLRAVKNLELEDALDWVRSRSVGVRHGLTCFSYSCFCIAIRANFAAKVPLSRLSLSPKSRFLALSLLPPAFLPVLRLASTQSLRPLATRLRKTRRGNLRSTNPQ